MTTTRSDRTAYLFLLGMAVSFGGTWVAGKVAVEEIPPFTLAAGRFGIAWLLLVAVARLQRHSIYRPVLRDVPIILGMGLTAIAGYNVLFLTGLTLAPASDGAIIVPGLAPILTVVLAWAVLGDRIGLRVAAGLAIAVSGLLLVIGPGGAGGAGGSQRLLGDLLFVLGAVFWAIYSVLGKIASARFDAVSATLYGTFTGTLFLLPPALLEGGVARIAAASPAALAGLAYLAVFGTVIAFVFLHEGLRRIGPSRAGSFALLVPVFGVISSMILLGEELRQLTVVGGAVVLAGVWLVQQRAPAPAEASREAVAETRPRPRLPE